MSQASIEKYYSRMTRREKAETAEQLDRQWFDLQTLLDAIKAMSLTEFKDSQHPGLSYAMAKEVRADQIEALEKEIADINMRLKLVG